MSECPVDSNRRWESCPEISRENCSRVELGLCPGQPSNLNERKHLFKKTTVAEVDAGKISYDDSWVLDVQLVGESCKKAVPKKINVVCKACRSSKPVNVMDEPSLLAKFLFQDRDITRELGDFIGNCCNWRKITFEVEEYADLKIVYLKDLPSYQSKYERSIFETLRGYATDHLIPSAKKVRVTGKIIQDPKTTDIVILLGSTSALEDEVLNFKITEADKANFDRYYKSNPSVLEGIDGWFVIPLVQQTLRKQLMVLVLHSPPWIRLTDGQIIRGLVRMILVGDTKTYKSRALAWVNENLQIGEKCEGESSSRAGLLYVIDPNTRSLTWGVIPRNDLGLVLIAGLHTVPPEQMMEFREVLESLKLKVTRMAEGEAFCRTRIIADTNPKQPSMVHYFYRCDAVRDIYPFAQAADLTRWDLFYTTKTGDVPPQEIVKSRDSPPTIPYEVQRRHILWAMSRRAEDIILSDGVEEQVNDTTRNLIDDYSSPTLPIVHDGFREVVWRLSVAMAATLHSVSDGTHQKVLLKPSHILMVETLLRTLYDTNLQLDLYISDERSKTMLTDKELEKVVASLDETDIAILKELRREPVQSFVLAERLRETIGEELDPSSVRKRAITLKALALIDSSQGRRSGYELTPKGMQVLGKFIPQKQVVTENSQVTGSGEGGREEGGSNPPSMEPVTCEKTVTSSKKPCEKCGSHSAKLHLIRGKGETWLCNKCLRDYPGEV